MVIDRSDVGTITVLASVARLLPAGSLVPIGAVTLAELLMVPLPLAVAVTVKVADPPESRLTAAEMSPLPDAGQLEPALAAQVQLMAERLAGKMSVTVAAVTAEGPALLATIVYVTVLPWFTLVTPSSLVIDRSAVGVMTVLLSVALLLPAGSLVPTGAVTVAVLLMVPAPLAVAVTVKVALPPLSRSTLAAMLPAPLAGQTEPAVAAQVQVAALSCAGNTSLTVAPVTADGPAFDATMV